MVIRLLVIRLWGLLSVVFFLMLTYLAQDAIMEDGKLWVIPLLLLISLLNFCTPWVGVWIYSVVRVIASRFVEPKWAFLLAAIISIAAFLLAAITLPFYPLLVSAMCAGYHSWKDLMGVSPKVDSQ